MANEVLTPMHDLAWHSTVHTKARIMDRLTLTPSTTSPDGDANEKATRTREIVEDKTGATIVFTSEVIYPKEPSHPSLPDGRDKFLSHTVTTFVRGSDGTVTDHVILRTTADRSEEPVWGPHGIFTYETFPPMEWSDKEAKKRNPYFPEPLPTALRNVSRADKAEELRRMPQPPARPARRRTR